jgi:hypothetical protein
VPPRADNGESAPARKVLMPELIVCRKNAIRPPMVCMYCGAPATATTEWREVNRTPEPGRNSGGGTDLSPVPTGDDPVSGLIAVVMLPLVIWELLRGLVAGIGAVAGFPTRPRPVPAPEPESRDAPTTLVVVTRAPGTVGSATASCGPVWAARSCSPDSGCGRSWRPNG